MQTTSDRLKLKYGDPFQDRAGFEKRHMRLFKYPDDIKKAIPSLGESIYCNMDIWPRYVKTLRDLIKVDLHKEIKTNDECFCVRDIRGVPGQLSTHSWGVAVDLNVKDNPLGLSREQAWEKGLNPFSINFIKVWRDNGWICGIDFKRRPDGMHFEGSKFVLQ